MKIKCSIIKDILPLFAENIVSEDTRMLVETHIEECIDCKKELEEIKSSENLPVDINSAGFKSVKTKLLREKFKAIIFAVLLTMILSILSINYLTEPKYIPYSNEIVSINTKDNGEIFADFDDKVSGYDINKYLSEDGSTYVYHISTWQTYWNKLFNNKKLGTVVLNPNGEKITSIYYYSTNQSGDILIYGKNITGNGGIVTLPRLFLAAYLRIAIILMVICLIILLTLQKCKGARSIMEKIICIPISYIIGTLCIKGFNTASYLGTRDLFIIVLISLPIYFLLLSTISLYTNFKNKNY